MKQVVSSMSCIARPLIKFSISEINRLRLNLGFICAVVYIVNIGTFIVSPSLHQFVTSNSSDDSVSPGLGLDETWYSAIIGIQACGIIVGAISYGIIGRYMYFKFAIICSLLLYISGGLLHSFAVNGWMLLLSRFLVGTGLGIAQSSTRTYTGESSDHTVAKLEMTSTSKFSNFLCSPAKLKYTNFFIIFIVGALGIATGPLLEAIFSHITILDQFRWPGYYITAHSFVVLIFFCLFFDENWSDLTRGTTHKSPSKPHSKLCCKKSTGLTPIFLVVISSFLMLGATMCVMETLENPILSDNFGLTIEFTSYIFVCTLSMFILATIIVYLLQLCYIDNRIILIFTCIIGIIGCATVGDWQSIQGDPCHQITPCDVNNNSSLDGTDGLLDCIENFQCSSEDDRPECNLNFTLMTTNCTNNEECMCELYGSLSNNDCFWNPKSRITGEYCDRCRPACLSKRHSLCLPQLIIGISLIAIFTIMQRNVLVAIISDLTAHTDQGLGIFIAMMVTFGSLGRAIAPFWSESMYLAAGHRTWLPMLFMTSIQLFILFNYIILYRKLKPDKKLPAVGDNMDSAELLHFEDVELDEIENK